MKPAGTQQDRNMNFDGMESIAPKGSTKYQTNAWSGHMNDGRLVNKGRGPTKGNTGSEALKVGPSVTKDAFRRAPDSASGTQQKRNPGGTRAWEPSKGQNYRGNPDSIRVGQGGGTSYGAVTRGSRPVAPGSTSGINYGPKSQY